MTYTHRPTPLPGADPRTDRTVLYNGAIIARIYVIEHGPQEGLWGWFLQWMTTDNSGVAASLAEALAIVKERHARAFLSPSGAVPPSPHQRTQT